MTFHYGWIDAAQEPFQLSEICSPCHITSIKARPCTSLGPPWVPDVPVPLQGDGPLALPTSSTHPAHGTQLLPPLRPHASPDPTMIQGQASPQPCKPGLSSKWKDPAASRWHGGEVMPAGSSPRDSDGAGLATDCIQKLLFLWEGGCKGRIPTQSPVGWGEHNPPLHGWQSPTRVHQGSPGAVVATSASGMMDFG